MELYYILTNERLLMRGADLLNLSSKEKIKKASLSLFAKKGYMGTSMSDVGNEVGLNKASIYSHYANKEELFFTAYRASQKTVI